MTTSTLSRWLLPSLVTAALLSSSLALADHHGGYKGKRHHGDVCAHMKEGKGKFDRDAMRAKMEARHNEIAERLSLTSEQRNIWDEIHQERQAAWEKRMQQMQERMEKRCNGKMDE
ncbi:hypothetical protein [Marinobacter sp. X15-166B]|uniref:hypothetical protein n=1 Tax=Marinobacter sp. X15-166B TaxID=1897620 RepID=UPI00085C5E66|nr:hypothetical protein [Marinobacter sp. X15-166B]OEY65310.1 hypothetical protein BG841_01750 [Marinobacter sp. X15-166B]